MFFLFSPGEQKLLLSNFKRLLGLSTIPLVISLIFLSFFLNASLDRSSSREIKSRSDFIDSNCIFTLALISSISDDFLSKTFCLSVRSLFNFISHFLISSRSTDISPYKYENRHHCAKVRRGIKHSTNIYVIKKNSYIFRILDGH